MLYKIGEYTVMGLSIVLPLATWRFADWRGWKNYYPTILFIIFVNSASTILTCNRSLWYFHDVFFIQNHIIADFFIELTNLPCIILLFLSRYPDRVRPFKKVAYTSLWVIAFSLIEWFFLNTGVLSYHNGWNLAWSIFLWAAMFLIMRLHHSKPLWAWLICLLITLGVIYYFDLPIMKLK